MRRACSNCQHCAAGIKPPSPKHGATQTTMPRCARTARSYRISESEHLQGVRGGNEAVYLTRNESSDSDRLAAIERSLQSTCQAREPPHGGSRKKRCNDLKLKGSGELQCMTVRAVDAMQRRAAM